MWRIAIADLQQSTGFMRYLEELIGQGQKIIALVRKVALNEALKLLRELGYVFVIVE